jgi:hypothetical protein
MKKSILTLTAIAILAGSAASYAVAQQPSPEPAKQKESDYRWQPSSADLTAFANARVAALHAGLALTPEQEKLWPPVESVLKDMAQKREVRIAERRAEREKGDAPRPDIMERLRRSADFMTQAGADMKRLADAAQPLYDKLDDTQKRRLEDMIRTSMQERREWMMHRGMRDRGRGPRGRDRRRDSDDEGDEL